MSHYHGIDVRTFTELSHRDQDRVIAFTERVLSRPVIPDASRDIYVVLQQSELYRMSARKPVSSPPSPTHIKHVTRSDTIEAPATK